MKMTSKRMVDILQERLKEGAYTYHFDRKKDTLRIEEKHVNKGVTISLPGLIAKYEENKEQAIEEFIYYIQESFQAMKDDQQLSGKEKNILPVIRSTSFPIKSSEGIPLVYDEHTAETRIYYALDLGKSYRLIDQKLMDSENWSHQRIKEMALFNLRSLETVVKKDQVAGNDFYFVRTNDGYDASRILNESLLQQYAKKVSGDMVVAVPHQDVLIIGDIQNEAGYDILAQLTMSFFANGLVPITALSFIYENGELDPIFILGKNRKKDK
ncbi:DUF1444 domain-containing protein [Bacillus sp. FJAT-47783]|uniref:DUF1444 domain-containing protein n=1 Tax=Bacillus sp. FJAT-47783 TaxID=2922712 RepID=UPI001FAD1050|nr:DUF1444 domain-containing protein [Bacillus sp. FJAT-47783]